MATTKQKIEWYAKQKRPLHCHGLLYRRGMGVDLERAAIDGRLFKQLLSGEWLAHRDDSEVRAGRANLGLDISGATSDEGIVINTQTDEPVAAAARLEWETNLEEAEIIKLRTAEVTEELKVAEHYASIDLKAHIRELKSKLDTMRAEAEAHRDRAAQILGDDCKRRGVEPNGTPRSEA